jgi:hypothetical protein
MFKCDECRAPAGGDDLVECPGCGAAPRLCSACAAKPCRACGWRNPSTGRRDLRDDEGASRGPPKA